jgi:hypothetical protein
MKMIFKFFFFKGKRLAKWLSNKTLSMEKSQRKILPGARCIDMRRNEDIDNHLNHGAVVGLKLYQ